MCISFLNLNIEGEKHLDRVSRLLQKECPAVFCAQEVFLESLHFFKNLGYGTFFAPMGKKIYSANTTRTFGTAIMWKEGEIDKISTSFHYYVGSKDKIPEYNLSNPNEIPEKNHTGQKFSPHRRSMRWLIQKNPCNRVLIFGTFAKNKKKYNIATTHFTWTPDGNPTKQQKEDFGELMRKINPLNQQIILCGDFNAPRGGEIYDTLAKKFTDNVPKNIKSTIDEELHEVKGLQYVVDSIFTGKHYSAKDVKVISGVSDHKAIKAMICKNNIK